MTEWRPSEGPDEPDGPVSEPVDPEPTEAGGYGSEEVTETENPEEHSSKGYDQSGSDIDEDGEDYMDVDSIIGGDIPDDSGEGADTGADDEKYSSIISYFVKILKEFLKICKDEIDKNLVRKIVGDYMTENFKQDTKYKVKTQDIK